MQEIDLSEEFNSTLNLNQSTIETVADSIVSNKPTNKSNKKTYDTKNNYTSSQRNKKIVNKSKLSIDNDTQQLLSKGLSYVPDKNKEDISEIISDVEEWGRRLKLKVHFNGNRNNTNQHDRENED